MQGGSRQISLTVPLLKVDALEVNSELDETKAEPVNEIEEPRGRRRYKKSTAPFQLVNNESTEGIRKPPAAPKPSKKKYE